jgi:hypothetical protein
VTRNNNVTVVGCDKESATVGSWGSLPEIRSRPKSHLKYFTPLVTREGKRADNK